VAPSGPVQPIIDGEITSYFEWMGAGLYRADDRSGSMHGKKFLVKEVYYGGDGSNLFLRVDFHQGSEQAVSEMEARLSITGGNGRNSSLTIKLDHGRASVTEVDLADPGEKNAIEFAFSQILEARLSLAALGVRDDSPVHFQFSLWQGGLPMDAIPQQGWLEMPTAAPAEWPV